MWGLRRLSPTRRAGGAGAGPRSAPVPCSRRSRCTSVWPRRAGSGGAEGTDRRAQPGWLWRDSSCPQPTSPRQPHAMGQPRLLTRKGPCSLRNPSMELQPGPPFSHSTRGLLWGSRWASTNLRTHRRQQPVPGRAQPWCSGAPALVPAHPHVPVVQVLARAGAEVARVVAERGLLGQPRQERHLVLRGGGPALPRQQQQRQHPQQNRPHLRGREGRSVRCGPGAAAAPAVPHAAPHPVWSRSPWDTRSRLGASPPSPVPLTPAASGRAPLPRCPPPRPSGPADPGRSRRGSRRRR